MLERVLKGTPITLQKQFYEAGDPTDPGVVTVDITRDDGTVLVNDGATTGSGTNVRARTLSSATETNLLDFLRVDWTSPSKGTLTSWVEVGGGFLFTLDEMQADAAFAGKSAAQLAELRTEAEIDIERALGVACFPRYWSETLHGRRSYFLKTEWARPRLLRSGSQDGVALTAPEIADINPLRSGFYNERAWRSGSANVVLRYEHGYDFPPAGAGRAAFRLAKERAPDDRLDDRVVRAQAGEESFSYITRSSRSRSFDIPEVDRFLRDVSHRALVA